MTARALPAPLVGRHEADVVVLGAGLSGLATTLGLLATPGRRVAVIEAGSVAAGASGADLGHVATGLGCPYTRAVAQYGSASATAIWEWHRESHERLLAQIEAMGDPCGYESKGGFLLARDRPDAIELADSEDALRDLGFVGEFLDHYMLEARFDVRGFSGAYWAADDAEVDSVALLGALAGEAVARGAAVFEASPVESLEADERGVRARTGGGEVRAAFGVVALGARAPLLVPALAPVLQPFPARRLVRTYPSGPAFPSPVRTVGGDFAWRVGRDFSAAGFGEAASSVEAIEGVLEAHLVAPTRPEGRWAGTLCAAPDGLPLVGPLPGSPLAVVLGLGTLGHSWAFVAARWVAEAITRGADPTPSLLRASRVLGAFPASS